MVSDLASVIWHNLRQTPMLSRIFYVPFWECPYRCDFCCVDSLPGRPPADLDRGEDMLFELIAELHQRTGKPLGLHYYGGEPLMRPEYLAQVAERAMRDPAVGKFYVYSTLKLKGIDLVLDVVPRDRLRIVVNTDTVDDFVRAEVARLEGIAEYYTNPTVFHTGRGRAGCEGYQEAWFERVLPRALPGRSCFATASGMLVNGPHHSVHLCCLPQSPEVGRLDMPAAQVVDQYLARLKTYHKEALAQMRRDKLMHACQTCEANSRFESTRHGPATEQPLRFMPAGAASAE